MKMFYAIKKRIAFLLVCFILLGFLSSCTVTISIKEPDSSTQTFLTTIDSTKEAVRLVLKDMWAIDFLINLEMNGDFICDVYSPGLSVLPVIVPEYADFDNLMAELDGIYASTDVYSQFFRYPIFGDPQVFSLDGETYVYPHYFSNFRTCIDIKTIKITNLTPDSAEFAFDILNHDFFTDGSMSMTFTDSGWRLDRSFFF